MVRTPTRVVRFSRRDALKLAQVGGLGLAAGGLGVLGMESRAEAVTQGTCRLCTMHCGILAHTRGSRLVRVEGDPTSNTRGFVCLNGQSLREVVHSDDRVRTPLKRQGEAFVPLAWDQALTEVAERLNRIKDEFGPQALAIQTGWPFVRHPMVVMLHRFCHFFGTPNLATVASLCESSGRMGRALTVGSNFWPDLNRARTLMVWGANPAHSAPPFSHLVTGQNRPGHNLIVVDPVKTEIAQRATLHLPIRPGTDGALALGMINHIVSQGWHDEVFITRHADGFGDLRALAERYPLDEVARITELPAGDIARAAELFARAGPSSVWDGLGVEHHENGVQTIRAIAALQVICGYVGNPGGGALHDKPGEHFYDEPLPGQGRLGTAEPRPPQPPARPIGYDAYPLFDVFNRQAQAMLFSDAILEDKPYPLRALILVGSNALITGPGSARMRKAADKLSLLVTVDPFLTASGELSDYVLPAATFAEAPDVGPKDNVARSGLVREQHQSWSDWRVFAELAKALGMKDYAPWPAFREAWDAPRKPSPVAQDRLLRPAPRKEGMPTVPRFPTESGRAELYSPVMQRFGYDPLPSYQPPSLQPQPEFPWILVSGPRTRAFINSQFRNIPSILAKMPEPLAMLHPSTAAQARVQDRQRVAVVSPYGQVVMRAQVTADVRPGVVVIPSGWATANANELTQDAPRDPVSGFPVLRSRICRVEAVRTS